MPPLCNPSGVESTISPCPGVASSAPWSRSATPGYISVDGLRPSPTPSPGTTYRDRWPEAIPRSVTGGCGQPPRRRRPLPPARTSPSDPQPRRGCTPSVQAPRPLPPLCNPSEVESTISPCPGVASSAPWSRSATPGYISVDGLRPSPTPSPGTTYRDRWPEAIPRSVTGGCGQPPRRRRP
ncbi:MAG: hypothetical protein NC484_09395, partial [Alloprevotella sp.]|nr:hypothetical protein [Alloprevotella sp.]